MASIREELIAHVEPIGPRGAVIGYVFTHLVRDNPTPPPEPDSPEARAFHAWRDWTPHAPVAPAAPPAPEPAPPETRRRPRPQPHAPD